MTGLFRNMKNRSRNLSVNSLEGSFLINNDDLIESQELHCSPTQMVASLSDSNKPKAFMSLPFSIISLLITVVGAGILSLPYAFTIGGLIPSIINLIVTAVISILSGILLIDCVSFLPSGIKVFNYEDLASFCLGRIGKVSVLLTIIVLLIPSHIAYMILARDQLELIISFASNRLNATNSEITNIFEMNVVILSIAYIPVLPMCFFSSLRLLSLPSMIGSMATFIVAIFFAIQTINDFIFYPHDIEFKSFCSNSSHSSMESFNSNSSTCIQIFPISIFKFLQSFTFIVLVFVCHFNILPLKSELYNPTSTRAKIGLYATILLALFIYLFVIIFTLIDKGSSLNPDVMKSYSYLNVLIFVGRCFLLFQIVLSYPLLLFPCRAAVISLLVPIFKFILHHRCFCFLDKNNNREKGTDVFKSSERFLAKSGYKLKIFGWTVLTLILFFTAFIPSIFISSVDLVWGFVGSLGSALVVFIWPSLFYIKLIQIRNKKLNLSNYKLGVKGYVGVLLIIMGILIMIFCTLNQVLTIAVPNIFT